MRRRALIALIGVEVPSKLLFTADEMME